MSNGREEALCVAHILSSVKVMKWLRNFFLSQLGSTDAPVLQGVNRTGKEKVVPMVATHFVEM